MTVADFCLEAIKALGPSLAAGVVGYWATRGAEHRDRDRRLEEYARQLAERAAEDTAQYIDSVWGVFAAYGKLREQPPGPLRANTNQEAYDSAVASRNDRLRRFQTTIVLLKMNSLEAAAKYMSELSHLGMEAVLAQGRQDSAASKERFNALVAKMGKELPVAFSKLFVRKVRPLTRLRNWVQEFRDGQWM